MAQSGHRDALGQCPLMIQRGHEGHRIFARRPAEIYDAELDKDGKALRPDGKQAGTLIAPAFGLAGVNLHTWTGFGSVPYWNAYVGVGEMHAPGTFFDARLNDKDQYPVAAKKGAGNVNGQEKCATCHVPPLFTNQGITCMRQARSASTRSRPIGPRLTCTAPRRWRDYGRINRVASITMDASPRCSMW